VGIRVVIKQYFKLLKSYLHLAIYLNSRFYLLGLLIAREFLRSN